MKLTVLGGGGFRTPYIYHALLDDPGRPRVTELALFDPSPSRLRAMEAVLAQLGASAPDAPRVTTTTDARTAIEGSDFVFAAVRAGGLEGRRCDEQIARDLGVLGQETTGPGGIAFAIRTVPVMLEYARLIAELAPGAYLLNFTNPAGIVTEALQTVLGARVIGICDTPSGLCRRLARAAGLPADRLAADYVGLNHLGWLRGLRHDGRDVLPDLIADDRMLESLEEAHIFGPAWIRALGEIPNEYLHYYYNHREALRSIRDASSTRGEQLARSQGELFARLEESPHLAAKLWLDAVNERNAGYMAEARGATAAADEEKERSTQDVLAAGYAGVAIGVLRAISRDERATMILNVRNGGTIHGLPHDAVIEVPALVDADGASPLSTPPPSLHQLGLMQQVKAVEQHAINAAVHRDRTEALKAFALHPLVDSVAVGGRLLAGYMDRIPEVAAALGASGS